MEESIFNRAPVQNKQSINVQKSTIKYLKGLDCLCTPALDVGPRSPLTNEIEDVFGIRMDNTYGDLDVSFTTKKKFYKFVLYSHTIEHQFNPLFTLLELKKIIDKNSYMLIILPRRIKLLWTLSHYHEIDHYRMRALLDRAGYKIESYSKSRARRPWYQYLTGIRPLLRLFFEYNAFYLVKIK